MRFAQATNLDAEQQARAVMASLRTPVIRELRRLLADAEEGASAASTAGGGPQLNGAARKLEDPNWLREAYAGQSLAGIGAELGVNEKTVRRWLTKHGIQARPSGQSVLGLPQRREVQKGRVIEGLKQLAADLGRPPVVSDWQGWPDKPMDEKNVRAIFGAWGNAMEAAGFPRPTNTGPRLDRQATMLKHRERLLDAVKAWAEEFGGGDGPTMAEWTVNKPPDAPHNHEAAGFTTWNEVLKAAGLPIHPQGWRRKEYAASPARPKRGRNRQMVTGRGLSDRLPGTVKHFGSAA